jgi:hypothetical protein
MAKAKESEVDAWTSNGKGIIMIGEPTPEQKAAVDKLNRELAAQQTPNPLRATDSTDKNGNTETE